jgi:hypothetical protein
MSDRDEMARTALLGLLSGQHVGLGGTGSDEGAVQRLVVAAYQIADAMLAERAKKAKAGAL